MRRRYARHQARRHPGAITVVRGWGDAAVAAGSRVDGGWASLCVPMAPRAPWRPA